MGTVRDKKRRKMMKWYLNQKIKNKLILGFLVLSIIAAIVGGVGIVTIVQIKSDSDKMYQESTMAMQFAGSAAMKTHALVSNAQSLSQMNPASQKSSIQANSEGIITTMAEVDGILSSLGNVVDNNVKESTFQDINSSWSNLENIINTVVKCMGEEDGATRAVVSMKLANTVTSLLTTNYMELFESVAKEADMRASANNSQANIAMTIMASVLAVGIVLSIILGIAIAKSIGNPLKVMAAAGMRIAEGDVNIDDIIGEKDRALTTRKDEIGALSAMLNKLTEGAKQQTGDMKSVAGGDLTVDIKLRSDRDDLGLNLKELVESFHDLAQSIVKEAGQLVLSSDVVSNSSIVLSQGATEQASAIEELNVTIEGISAQTRLNAENAANANELAQKAKANAVNGNKQMKDMLVAMDNINESSKNINKVIKVIDDIAFQTNILALNAAVEAARAGQSGKGFAVVAKEVRALAARSAAAVNQTTEMIEGSIRKVEAGTRIAGETAKALTEILVQVDKAAELVSAIDVASKEQALGIAQIHQGMRQVSQVVQTNAATAEESAAASQELSSQSAQLKEQVGAFKLRGNGESREQESISISGNESGKY
jgi:methyl-accepting chemotaxis protein